jgi:hypothetical protein
MKRSEQGQTGSHGRDSLEIKADSAHDELVRREPLVDAVRIVHDARAKDDAAADSEEHVKGPVEGGDHEVHEGRRACGWVNVEWLLSRRTHRGR